MKLSEPKKVLLLAASTGGPGQIHKILAALPTLQDTSVLIAQHMAKGFMQSFADRLNSPNNENIIIPKEKQPFEKSKLYLCENSISVVRNHTDFFFHKNERKATHFNPDINNIFNSFIPFCGKIELLCVILTGIGDDGVDAAVSLSKNGARCITETSNSAIVDGMPSRARELVPNIEIYELDEIIEVIKRFCA